MISLPIHKSTTGNDEDDTPNEWSLLELNGELLPPRKIPTGMTTNEPPYSTNQLNTNSSSLELGSIHYDKNGSPTMIIGSHELKGKVQKLKEPFLIMKPYKRSTHQSNNDISDLIPENTTTKRLKLSHQNDDDMNAEMDASTTSIPNTNSIGNENNSTHHESNDIAGYEILGYVKTKILFDTYPKTIIR